MTQLAVNKDMIDPSVVRAIKLEAIKEFVNQVEKMNMKHSSDSELEDKVVAIGYFGLSISDFYDKTIPFESHGDYFLAEIQRQKMKRDREVHDGTYPKEYLLNSER